MNRERIRLIVQLLLYVALAMFAAVPALAQVPVDDDGNPIAPLVDGADIENFDDGELPTLSVAELEDIVGPIALYPDDLLAVILPASTYPLQVVQAARFLERLKADPSLKPDDKWDESVTALLNYPEAIELMNEDIDWTWRLGEAVVAQQADVIAAIESFRDKAYAAGNLKSDERQTVSNEDGVIEIEPANEDVIYVPYYEPESVVVYQPRPVYHYYPKPYPVYYYPYPYGHSFGSGYFWGVTTAFRIGWLTHHLHVHHHSYWGHPYYGYHYNNRHYYRRSSLSHYHRYYVHNRHSYWNDRFRDGDYWRPSRHGGARPGYHQQRVHYYRDRNRDDWRHRGNDHGTTRQGGSDVGAGRWASNRGDDRDHRGNDGRQRNRYEIDGNADNRRERGGNGDRQARNRERGDQGDRQDGNNFASSSDRSRISFRPRDGRARADQERRRIRASQDPNGRSQQHKGFAPGSGGSSSAPTEHRASVTRTVYPSVGQPVDGTRRIALNSNSSFRSGNDRSRAATLTNTRRQVLQPPPRQVSSPSFQRPPTRSQPQRSTPARSAASPSTPKRSASSNRKSESRSTGSRSRGSFSRERSRSRRRN